MRKRTIAALLISTMTAAVLSGCSGSDSGTAKPGESKTAETAAAETDTAGTKAAEEAGNTAPLADGEYTIGIAQYAVHGSLDNCREGFLKGLADEGFVENENLKIIYENANGDGSLSGQIITNFVSNDVDLICAIATPIAQSAYGVTKRTDIPVVYTAVTNPVLAELATEDQMPVGEITGTSDKLPVSEQLSMIRKLLPEAKTVGILYSTNEVNSQAAIEEYKQAAPEYGLEIVESGISTVADIPLAAEQLAAKVDCISNLTDNNVVSSLPVVLDASNKNGIPVFGSEIEQVKKGCLAAMGLDYVALGEQTGRMAAKVLKGETKASEMPYELIEGASFYGNTAVAENLGITLPEELTDSAAEIFDEIAQ